MIRLVNLIFLILLLSGCAYEPILLKKNYDFNFVEINSNGEPKINEIITNRLANNTKISSDTDYKIFFQSVKDKKVISSNKKGDPTIYKITVKLKYKIMQNNKAIIENEIIKQTTYNNIDDKFELLKREENMIKNLSEKFADDILYRLQNF
ncbi:MAG: LPS assembly lipoprotein LptE [Pseudomonadota bacterium]|nr:hypothetical protein [Candidatus Pelagibacter sp.]MEC8074210.1 LPS assembly lipoprotein LptE [Pseudomonadota bacterium]